MRPDLLAGLFLAFPGKKSARGIFFRPTGIWLCKHVFAKFFYAFEKKTISIPYAMDRQVMCARIKHNAGHQ